MPLCMDEYQGAKLLIESITTFKGGVVAALSKFMYLTNLLFNRGTRVSVPRIKSLKGDFAFIINHLFFYIILKDLSLFRKARFL